MDAMKVGIVGAGAVGTACMFAMVLRGSAREIVLVNRNRDRAKGAVADLQYGSVLTPVVALRCGEYADLRGAQIVVITAGVNFIFDRGSRLTFGVGIPVTGPQPYDAEGIVQLDIRF